MKTTSFELQQCICLFLESVTFRFFIDVDKLFKKTGSLTKQWCSIGWFCWKRVLGWTGDGLLLCSNTAFLKILRFICSYTNLRCCFTNFRWKLSRRSLNMLLSWEELAKDMVGLHTLFNDCIFFILKYTAVIYLYCVPLILTLPLWLWYRCLAFRSDVAARGSCCLKEKIEFRLPFVFFHCCLGKFGY